MHAVHRPPGNLPGRAPGVPQATQFLSDFSAILRPFINRNGILWQHIAELLLTSVPPWK